MHEMNLLLKVEFKHILNSLNPKSVKDSKGKQKSIAFTVIIAFAAVMMVFYAVMYSVVMAQAFKTVNALYLLPALMMTSSCIVILFTTIYKVKGILFGFNDYDFLMSLPIKTNTIVISRLVILYTINFVFCLILMLPAGGVYIYYAAPGLSFYIGFLLSFLFVPLVPIVIAAIIGLIIHLIASRFKYKNVANLILTLGLFSVLMYLSFNMGNFVTNAVNIGKMVMTKVNHMYPLTLTYTNAVCNSDYIALFLFIAISLSAFLIFSFAVGYRFKSLNTLLAANRTTSDYKVTSLNVSTPFMALYKRELKRYFSSVNYVLNTGVGYLLFTMASVALLISGPEKLKMILPIPNLTETIASIGPIAISFFIVLSCSTACSISLEGKHLWIVKSAPVETKTIFLSKLALNLTLSIPAILINVSIFAFVFKLGTAQMLLLYLVPAAYALFTALSGLVVNLAYPNFTWTTEIMVIKQSASVLIELLVGFISLAVPFILMFSLHLQNSLIIPCVTFLFLIVVSGILYRYLMSKGVKTFLTF